MTGSALSARDARVLSPAVTPIPSTKRAAVRLRRAWRGYLEHQAQRAVAVMLYAMDDRTLADLGVDRDGLAVLVDDRTIPSARSASCAPASGRTTH
jgi:uncharacterized protein YjiS (DUF1127 family)